MGPKDCISLHALAHGHLLVSILRRERKVKLKRRHYFEIEIGIVGESFFCFLS